MAKLARNEPTHSTGNKYVTGKKSELSNMTDASQRRVKGVLILKISAAHHLIVFPVTYDTAKSERPASNSIGFETHTGSTPIALPVAQKAVITAMAFILGVESSGWCWFQNIGGC